jgi:hypothetical protein
MNRMDEILAQQLKIEKSADEAIAMRVLASLAAKPLPTQRHSFLKGWPDVLLNFEFTPAWPRVGALAFVGLVGCMIGFFSPGAQIFEKPRVAPVLVADIDASTLAFDPEPLTGIRP